MNLPKEPCRYTCPDIDRLQKTIDSLINNFSNFKEDDNTEDFLESMSEASYELRDIYNTLEELRRSNADLRDWGHELTTLAENMESEKDDEIGELVDKISDLEHTITLLEEEIAG